MAEFFRSLFGISNPQRTDPNDVRSTFLFVEPSFLNGAGRVFDLWGGFDLYSVSRNNEEANLRALYTDWRVVGQDIRNTVCSEVSAL
jgi:hypothetical protein